VDLETCEWEYLLPWAEFAFNNSLHSATKTTPFQLNYGREPRGPLTWLNGELEGEDRQLLPRADMEGKLGAVAEQLVQTVNAAIKKARGCLEAAQQRDARHYNEKHRPVVFEVGDQVLLSTKNLRKNTELPGDAEIKRKLYPRFIGPFTIRETIGTLAYKLDLPDSLKVHPVFHVSLLKKYNADADHPPPPLPIIFEGRPEWEVEDILEHDRIRKGRGHREEIYYLIKWKGYDAKYNSWLPEENLVHCTRLRAEYWDRPTTKEVDAKVAAQRSRRQSKRLSQGGKLQGSRWAPENTP
jgi:hypothetical protein